jgi:hypothetical protein
LVPLAWVGIVFYIIYLLRASLPSLLNRLLGVEIYGVRLSMSTVAQALAEAVELAEKNPHWPVVVAEADRRRALERAEKERHRMEGAEILWVDDHPSNNRNEVRHARRFRGKSHVRLYYRRGVGGDSAR